MCARAAEDGQPAIAITDHGNLFGAIEFAQARRRSTASSRSSASRPTSRRARGTSASRSPVEGVGTQELLPPGPAGRELRRLQEPDPPGHRRATSRASTTGRASTRSCCASTARAWSACRPAWPVRCATLPAARPATSGRAGAAGEFRDLFGADRFWLELQDHGIPEQQRGERGLVRLARELGHRARGDERLPLPAARGPRGARRADLHPDRHDGQRPRSGWPTRAQHYLKTPGRDGRSCSPGCPRRCENTLAVAERCRFAFEKQPLHLPEFPVPAGYDLDGYFEKVARDGLERRLRRAARRRATPAGCATRSRPTASASSARSRSSGEMGFAGLLPDRLGLHPLRARGRDPGRAGPRLGGGLARRLLPADHRHRPAAVRPAVRALPEPRARQHARHRHRLLLPQARAGDRLRHRASTAATNVAQIITFGTMAARAVIRDVGRVLEMPYAEVDRIAKLVPAQSRARRSRSSRRWPRCRTLREAYEQDAAGRARCSTWRSASRG